MAELTEILLERRAVTQEMVDRFASGPVDDYTLGYLHGQLRGLTAAAQILDGTFKPEAVRRLAKPQEIRRGG